MITGTWKRLKAAFVVDAGAGGLVAEAPPVPVREIVRRFWPYARAYRGWILVSCLFIALEAAVETAAIWVFKLLVDDVLVPHRLDLLKWVAAAYVGITLLSGMIGFADEVLSTWVSERFLLDLRVRFFSHLQALPLEFFEGRRLGDVFFVGALVYLQWDLAIVSLVVVPAFYLAAQRTSRLLKRASREKRRRSGSIGAVAEESLANTALVQAYGREAAER